MAYEKLSVVYEYRDDPSYESDDETADDDWWKKEDDLQKEKKSGFLSSESKHNYDKVPAKGSPEKSLTDRKDKDMKGKSNESKSPDTDRKTMSERFKGALSSASEGLGNWLLTSTSSSVPVDPFMCGDGGLAADNINRAFYSSRTTVPRN
ncbi:uncharacterized protein [Apostichopus japonicus]|uniref:uncharacterized protein n=1 Tax=Stichopus japonicus TaxID=307972 RepID=UPI003AB1A13C